MSAAEKDWWNHGKVGGNYAAFLRRRRLEWQREMADEEMRAYREAGEPSLVSPTGRIISGEIFPLSEEEFRLSQVRREIRGRSGDAAKRRAVIINTVLQEPQSFLLTKQNMSFVERQFRRVYRFAITLRNKGTLHPRVQKILGL